MELAGGDLLAAWFGGTREGAHDVAIWGSRRHAGAWSAPRVLARVPGVACWNPVLFRDPSGKIWLFYKYGPDPQSWRGAYRTSSDGETWSESADLPPGILGPIKDKPIVLSNGDVLAGSSVETPRSWTCWVDISTDQCRTWQRYGPITVAGPYRGIIQPTVWEVKPGEVRMLVRATRDIGFICEAKSTDNGRTWSHAEPTSLPNPNSGIDAVKLQDGVIALAYNHSHDQRTPLDLAFSRDNGLTWSQPLVLEHEPGEYSYPAIIQTSDGLLHVTYTWRRRRIKHVVINPRQLGY